MRSGTASIALVMLLACRPAEGTAPASVSAPPPATPDVAASPSHAEEPAEPEIRMAITFDDLPGEPEAMARILAALQQHEMPPAFGFVNGKKIVDHPERERSLRDWLAAGHRLGNHTFSHPHMNEVGVDAFIADIDANEPMLAALVGPAGDEAAWKYFRYPFLKQGFDAGSTAAVRQHLAAHDYRIAEVTIDFGDWAWNPAYARCLKKGDHDAIAALKKSFEGNARVFLGWADEAGRRAFGRPIPQVLLLHSGAFDGVMLDELLTLYERRGVIWIPLDEALDDEAYRTHVPPDDTYGDSLLEQVVRTRGADHPPWVRQPLALLDVVCR